MLKVIQTKLHENQIKKTERGEKKLQNRKVSVLSSLSRSLAHEGTVKALLKEGLCSQMLKLD